jgi:hypothetical protein
MTVTKKTSNRSGRVLVALAAAALAAGCSHLGVAPPPPEEFGLGPRTSAEGLYRATAVPAESIRVRELHGWTLRLEDASGLPVDGAEITVGGGMPQHRHGLPTRPRVTRSLGDGAYQVDGIRFNMGGWWEVTFDIVAAPGADRVTFNLDL